MIVVAISMSVTSVTMPSVAVTSVAMTMVRHSRRVCDQQEGQESRGELIKGILLS